MSEPRLEDIGDYNTLRGEKKKVVWAVILAGLLMGVVYSISSTIYDNYKEPIVVEKNLKKIPIP